MSRGEVGSQRRSGGDRGPLLTFRPRAYCGLADGVVEPEPPMPPELPEPGMVDEPEPPAPPELPEPGIVDDPAPPLVEPEPPPMGDSLG
ncbi:MAG TPA: hypothetical protein VF406_09690 [Thermodesulfobacteriota bacterium]